MRCPACNSELTGSSNIGFLGCYNRKCPAKTEAYHIRTEVVVQWNWWFASSYAIPFKHKNSWYVAIGPKYKYEWDDIADIGEPLTKLKRLGKVIQPSPIWGIPYRVCTETEVFSIPYMALPVNWQFNGEFDILVSKFDRYLNKLVLLEE